MADPLSGHELAGAIRSMYDASGRRDLAAIAQASPEVWHGWVAARLRGHDPVFPYARDEYPDGAADVFGRIAKNASNQHIDLSNFAEGAADFLATLDPATEKEHVLENAMDVLAHLRREHPPAQATLRQWVIDRKLLARDRALHRKALSALAAIQKRGDHSNHHIWSQWFKAPAGEGVDRSYFTPVAFAGYALSSQHVPAVQLRELLEYRNQTDASMKPAFAAALLSLWVDRESRQDIVRQELWAAVQGVTDKGVQQRHWDYFIVEVAERAGYTIRQWNDMTPTIPPVHQGSEAGIAAWIMPCSVPQTGFAVAR